MIRTLGLNCNVYERSLTTAPGAFIDDVAPQLADYEHTISATGGFETCTLPFGVDSIEDALLWAERLLCPVQVTGPDADLIWDGYISQVELRVGGRSRSFSLDALANRVRARYTTFLGTPGVTATASNSTSIALYGTRDGLLSLATLTQGGAETLRDSYLASRAFPRAVPQTTIRMGAADARGVEIVLTCAGWYYTLDWVLLERTDTSSEVATTQVGTLISGVSPGIGATNGFLSTATTLIASTGVSTTRKIEADTSYRAAIEQRLALGDTSDQRFAWGVFDAERRLTVAQWAGAAPTAIGYRVRLADAEVRTGNGAGVELWQVRPNAMVEDADLVPVGPPSGSVDVGGTFFLERVSFRATPDALELVMEPEASSGLDARIARVS